MTQHAQGYDAVLVDGDNVSRIEVMMMRDAAKDCRIRKFFGGDAHAGWGWFGGLDFVSVPKLGKESVDRAVAMEAVRLYLQEGVRRLLLVSHDMDYGDTAMHLRSMFDNLHVGIAANPRRVSEEYREELATNGITYIPLFELQRPILTAKLYAMHKELCTGFNGQPITLEAMGHALMREGLYMTRQLKSRQLKTDMTNLGFYVTEKPLRFTQEGQPVLVEQPEESMWNQNESISTFP